jgi:hypothetical protein
MQSQILLVCVLVQESPLGVRRLNPVLQATRILRSMSPCHSPNRLIISRRRPFLFSLIALPALLSCKESIIIHHHHRRVQATDRARDSKANS